MRKFCRDCIHEEVCATTHTEHTIGCDYWMPIKKNGRWEWREKWDVDAPNHNSTLEYCGWYCSQCGIELGEYMTTSTDEKHYLDDDIREPLLNYCPNCGAKMDGGADNG